MVSYNFNTLKKVTAAVTACVGLTACTSVNADPSSSPQIWQPTEPTVSAPYNPTNPGKTPEPSVIVETGSPDSALPLCNFVLLEDRSFQAINYYIDPVTQKAVFVPIVNINDVGVLNDGTKVCEGAGVGDRQTTREFCASAIGKQLSSGKDAAAFQFCGAS